MKIDHTKFKCSNNYVLIKPDPDFETLQRSGRETGLYLPDFKYENGNKIGVKERNSSVTGTVYAVPQALQFNLLDITTIRNNYTLHRKMNIRGELKNVCVNWDKQREIDQLYKGSTNFKTEIEIEKGDRVNFSYVAHMNCMDDGRVFETDEGMMYLIKYDQLYYTCSEKDEPIKMLNGFIVVEPEEIKIESHEVEGKQIQGTETQTGILLVNPKTKKKKRKYQLGTIRYFGSLCKGYLQEPNATDHTGELEKGMRLLYDPRGATTMEYVSHQTFSDKVLWLLQRKDILFLQQECDLDKIEF